MTVIYTITIFISAFLLFLIQPMISKLLLPQLGGSPAVWNTSMMFFQILLLLGYTYTHITSKWLGAKNQSLLHIAVLLLSILWLPISLNTTIGFSSSEYPISWLITSLFLSVGMPFFMLAASSPLLQLWMANTIHRHAQNPYFLYSASNIGSLLALLSYPFVIEPTLTLVAQTNGWSMLYIVYVLFIAGCAYYLRKHWSANRSAADVEAVESAPPEAKMKLYWVALAFFPSSLMLGLTTYITTDIASLPLFWIIPLALYLLTFIIAFSKYVRITDYALYAQNILVPLVAFTMVFSIQYPYINMTLHVLTFFATTIVCHGTLARKKPNAKYLTEYYVWLSFGGMLGGVFNAIVAPYIFSSPIEYTLAFIGALAVRPILGTYANPNRERKLDFLIPLGFAAVLASIYFVTNHYLLEYGSFLRSSDSKQSMMASPAIASSIQTAFIVVLYLIVMLGVDHTYKRPLRLMLLIVSLFISSHFTVLMLTEKDTDRRTYTNRNFFGITKISVDGEIVQMTHGTTDHGFQNHHPKYKGWLSSYYVMLGPVMKYLDSHLQNYPYAVIGLGTGTSACAGHKNQVVDFYEIDPDMVRIATNPEFFTYLRDCPTTYNIILGDGRIQIAKAADKRYGLIIVDAFSSDAIPVHLLTREAIAIYASKLADNGVIALHISNRHLNLLPITLAAAVDAGFEAIVPQYRKELNELEYASQWVLLTHDPAYFARAKKEAPHWIKLKTKENYIPRPWTDNYSNIIKLLTYW
jgi:hypothetical protein